MRLALALLLTAACSSPVFAPEATETSAVPLHSLTVQRPADPWLAARLEHAVGAWQDADVSIALDDHGIPVQYETLPDGWLAAYGHNRVAVQPWAFDRPDSLIEHALIHELGHAMGLGHAATGIMAPVASTIVCVDMDAAQLLGGVGTCH